jgi:tetratricopeptide (TPR) repeat protein
MADAGLRPQRPLPIGAFALPFGFMLLPGATPIEVRDGLLDGRLPAAWPDELAVHERALAGDIAGALVLLDGQDPVSRFNRFVLDPDGTDIATLREELGDELGVLVDVVAFAAGSTDAVPQPDTVDGEIAALALAGQAVAAMDAEDPERARSLLDDAVAAAAPMSSALTGVLHGAAAQAAKSAGDVQAAIDHLTAGIALLGGSDLTVGCAEQHLELAATYQELAGDRRDLLARAVHHYHSVLQLVSQEQAPELFATAHANLGTAYLTMPMVEASDQLRLGVAVGSLRAALEIFKPDTHPRQWSSAQLNLANALVYAPSTHQADNLVEAVELYEAVLEARSRDEDPVGYARVLANQGNVLAHLGMFEHARGKLVEARFIFEEFHEYEAVTSVRGVLDEIARQTTLAGAGSGS